MTVTALVYPALAAVGGEGWGAAHARHSRAVTPLVAVLYVVLVASGAWLLATGVTVPGAVGLAGAAAALLVTATVAGPLHGRLAAYDGALVRRLLVADRWRCAAAVVGAVAAAVAASG